MAPASPTLPYLAREYDYAEARRIADDLNLADPVAIALVRRGHRTVEDARAFLEADEVHDPAEFSGIDEAVGAISAAVADGRRITVHGDYDVDGICSTSVMIGALRRAGADCDWLIPDRLGDGYGLTAGSLAQLEARGTGLLVTVDCGIGSVAEVDAIRAAGIGVVVSDHHQPGEQLPACPIVHPTVCDYPFEGLCGAAVAAKLAQALERERTGAAAEMPDGDLVALATVADLVPLVGENRGLVRRGLARIRRSPRPGLLALMAISRVDPERIDEGDVAFRLGPRLNAAGRLYRADAGVELMLTDDRDRATAIAAELDAANHERRETERAVSNEAEAALRALPEEQRGAPVIVVAGAGWHPGVVGIVASRLVERHERPAIVLSVGDDGTAKGSGRSVGGFDLLAGLDACSELLSRYGGHRAAAGVELPAESVDEFRAALGAYAAEVVPAEGIGEPEAIDAIVGAESLDLGVAEQLATLAPFGQGNPGIRLLVPGARVGDVRPMGEDGKHARFNLSTGTLSARGVAFNANGKLEAAQRTPHDIAVRLEVNHWNGAIEPRAVLADTYERRQGEGEEGHRCTGGDADSAEEWWDRFSAALERDPDCPSMAAVHDPGNAGEGRRILDARRGSGIARIAELLSSGARVMVIAADAGRRSALAQPGTFAGSVGSACVCLRCPGDVLERRSADLETNLLITDWGSLERCSAGGRGFQHLVVVDPPTSADLDRLATTATGSGYVHLCWGPAPELAELCWEAEWEQRAALADIYRGIAAGPAEGEELRSLLSGSARYGRSPEAAARAVAVLCDLQIADRDAVGESRLLRVVSSVKTELERSGAFRAFSKTHQEGTKYLQSRRAEP